MQNSLQSHPPKNPLESPTQSHGPDEPDRTEVLQDAFADLELLHWMIRQFSVEGQGGTDFRYYAALEYLNRDVRQQVTTIESVLYKEGVL